MRDPVPAEALDALYLTARRAAPDQALRALGAVATGVPADLACNGFAIHHATAPNLADPAAPGQKVTLGETLDDQSLAAWSLRLSRCDALQPSPEALRPALVALRAGLLMRALDMAFLHLEGRESFGQKLLHHQLMKARFSTINAEVQQIRDALAVSGSAAGAAGASAGGAVLAAMQGRLTGQFREAAKLMGGHGLRAGRCHALEFLANMVWAVHAPRDAATIGGAA